MIVSFVIVTHFEIKYVRNFNTIHWIISFGGRVKKKERKNTGLFISPSGISDPCGTVAGMVTPKGNLSTEGETLQVSVLPYRCSIC